MRQWGDVRWVGPALSRTTTADTFRVWRWTDDEVAQRHIDDLRDPPGTTEAGLALTHGNVEQCSEPVDGSLGLVT